MHAPRRLVLLRHAKSSWKDTALPDEQRPLAPRGRRALLLLARHLRAIDLAADLVLCSPARRTRETWDGVRAELPAAEIRFVPEIYEATANELLTVVNRVERRFATVLLIGHNPGIADLADGLVSGGDEQALARLRQGFPTGALAVLPFEPDWAALTWHAARLAHFVRPRDLKG